MAQINIIPSRNLWRACTACAALLFLTPSVSRGGTFFVRSNGSDALSGASWATAKQSITNAMNAASAGDQIWVASGVYTQLVTMKAGVALYGGFNGTETALTQRNWSANLSWIHGNWKGSVVTIPTGAGPDTRIDGMAITGGAFTSTFGGGIACSGAGPVIANNFIFGNTAQGSIGGGIYLNFYQNVPPVAQPIVTNNIIYQNTALGAIGEAAGICVRNSSPLIAWNKILFNVAGDKGGGIACFGNSQPTIANNIIEANASSADAIGLGGGILATADDYDGQPVYFAVSSPIIINNVIAANGADSGGGLALVDTPPAAGAGGALVVNNTIVANSGSGIFFANASPTNSNNLIAFNSAGLERSDSSPITFKNNDVYGNSMLAKSTDFVGIPSAIGINNNISADPQVANQRIGDFRLEPESPCVNGGLTASVVPGWPDRSGNPRINGPAVDIGAYESTAVTLSSPTPIIHVSSTGSDANDGLSWASAKRTVQAGINGAAPGVILGGEVWVAQGTYTQHVTIPAFVYLYGGFAGNETARSGRNISANPTILDGASQPTVVQSLSAGYLVSALDGFTVQNGGIYTGGLSFTGSPEVQGGGINCQVSAPMIMNNVIRSNSVGTPFNSNGTSKGGGINLYVSHALISSNIITQNDVLDHTAGSGGGIYTLRSKPIITQNLLYWNHAVYGCAIYADLLSSIRLTGNTIVENSFYNNAPPTYYGAFDGAVLLEGCSSFLIDGNTIAGNQAGTGAGLDLKAPGTGIVQNNVIYANQAYSADSSSGMGGGIYYEGDDLNSVSFINNTIYGNSAPSPALGDMGGGIALNLMTNTIALVNNIIVSNSGGIWLRGGPAPATNYNNCVANPINYSGLSPLGPGIGDIHVDPKFTNAGAGNFRLVAGSPCIDAGSELYAPATDRDGIPRPLDGDGDGIAEVDIGAYEFVPATANPPVVQFTANPTYGTAPLTVVFSNLTAGVATNFLWNFGDNATSADANPLHTFSSAGNFTVSLTAIGPGGTNSFTRTNYVVVTVVFYDGVNLNDTNQLVGDWDGDGIPNVLEYALGTDPNNPADGSAGATPSIAQVGGSSYLELKYKQRVDAAILQIQYVPEVSGDKTNWFADNTHLSQVNVTPIDSEFNWVAVQDLTPLSPTAPQFMRLRIVYNSIQATSPVWVGSDTTIQGNGGSGSKLTLFSQRMVRSIAYAGKVSSVQDASLTDINSAWSEGQFGTNGVLSYVEFDNGYMIDIAYSSGASNTLLLANNLSGIASVGDSYRIRPHATVSSIFGAHNEAGMKAGPNPAVADNVLLLPAGAMAPLTLFYYSNPPIAFQGWVRGDTFTPDINEVVYPEQGIMVLRTALGDLPLYQYGPVKTGKTVVPVQPGFNFVSTFNIVSSVTLSNLNLYTGNNATGVVPGLNSSLSDNLIVVNPDDSVTTYFYYYKPGGYQGWLNAAGFSPSDNALLPVGTPFFILRQQKYGSFLWTEPVQ